MYTIRYTGTFKKDFKTIQKRKYEIDLLKSIIIALSNNLALPPSNETHKLSGNYSDCFECHIKPDWLLIWRYELDYNEIWFLRTGSHSDLF